MKKLVHGLLIGVSFATLALNAAARGGAGSSRRERPLTYTDLFLGSITVTTITAQNTLKALQKHHGKDLSEKAQTNIINLLSPGFYKDHGSSEGKITIGLYYAGYVNPESFIASVIYYFDLN